MVLFFGPPGSGKSVQGELLVVRNKCRWLSTGQLFRDSSDPEVLKRMATGELIDDELTNKVLDEALLNGDQKARIVLDGYPRNTMQAKWLEERLLSYNREIKCLIVFNVPKDELIKRLSGRGRTEDAPEVIERRLNIYYERTKPVIDFYRKRKVPVYEINGVGSVGVVHDRIQTAAEQCLRV
ncbi:MAG TPA: nucleoside monophosphate kinase [Candidatus Saccharimonadales bacterium]|nr:nucleoside monophosphate kinase [Candidatus Saccharimonadales bacterium]